MSCWLYHDWGPWFQYKEYFTLYPQWGPNKGKAIPIDEDWQKRKCLDCNKEEREQML